MLNKNIKIIVWGLIFFSVSIVTYCLLIDQSNDKPQPLTTAESRLVNRSCELLADTTRDAKCYFYRTHENGGFLLPLAILSNESARSRGQRDLLVLLSGGPGQGYATSSEELQAWSAKLERNGIEADFLVYDMRGTGDGRGRVHCKQYQEAVLHLLQQKIPLKEEVAQLNETLKSCIPQINQELSLIKLTEPRFDTGLFSTNENVLDLAGIISALGYENVHLWGVSYGSRVALAASNIKEVKTLILDSPYPLNKGSDNDMYRNIVASLELHESLYQKTMRKNNYEKIFSSAIKQLEKSVHAIQVQTWKEGTHVDFQFTSHRLFDLSLHVLYSPYLYPLYYSGLEAFNEDGTINENLQMVIEHFVSTVLDPSFNTMVYFATECTDNPIDGDETLESLIHTDPLFSSYLNAYRGQNPCKLFSQESNHWVHNMAIDNKPSIAFSGEFDPVTPNAWATELSRSYPHIKLHNVQGAGHGPLSGGYCDWSFINAFIEQQSIDVDVNCTAPE